MAGNVVEATYHPHFSSRDSSLDGDSVSIQCKDGISFQIPAAILRESSAFFRTMLSLPQGESSNHTTVIPIDESSHSIEPIFRIIMGKNFAPMTDMDDVEALYFIAEKYEFATPLVVVRVTLYQALLRSSALVWKIDNLIRAHCIACRAGWTDFIAQSAKALLSEDIFHSERARHLPRLSPHQLYELASVREDRKRAFTENLSAPQLFSKTMKECRSCSKPIAPHPWLTLRLRLLEEFTTNPSGNFITKRSFEAWPEAIEARSYACACGALAYNWEMTVANLVTTIPEFPPSVREQL